MHTNQDTLLPGCEALIVMPDYQGDGVLGKGEAGVFAARLKRLCHHHRELFWLPVVNGCNRDAMQRIAHEARARMREVVSGDLLYSDKRGLPAVLQDVYARMCHVHAEVDCGVVRIDHAEHPPELIPTLMTLSRDNHAMVIGSLLFAEGMLGDDDLDADRVFGETVRQVMKHPIRFSSAHGYQVIPLDAMPEVLEQAMRIFQRAEQMRKVSLAWGFDLSMILAADELGLPIMSHDVQGEVPRFRAKAKVETQLDAWRAVCEAYAQLQLEPAEESSGSVGDGGVERLAHQGEH